MENKIHLYQDLECAEKFLEWCIENNERESLIKTAKMTIKYITNQLRKETIR